MNNEDYCSYELSKALKVAGFDEPCDHYYCAFDNETDVRFWSIHPAQSQNGFTNPDGKVIADAPTLAHAQKWLREKKELCVTVYAQPYNGLPYYTGYILFEGDEKEVLDQDGHWYDDYEKCLSETISAALELIKKGE